MKNSHVDRERTRAIQWIALAGVAILMPPYVSRGFAIGDIPAINAFLLLHPVKNNFLPLFPYFQSTISILVLCVVLFGRPFSRAFSAVMLSAYLLSAFLQNISLSDRYGFAVCSSTLLISLLVASAWAAEISVFQNTFRRPPGTARRLVLYPLIFLALWFPIDPHSHLPDLNPKLFFSSGSLLTFCMTTVVALSVLLLYYPFVNRFVLRMTGWFGLLVGIGNLWLEFVYLPDLFWVGVLHIPLVILSLAGLALSGRNSEKSRNGSGEGAEMRRAPPMGKNSSEKILPGGRPAALRELREPPEVKVL
jgi:hypothetical protein